jgi:hypothetical protein
MASHDLHCSAEMCTTCREFVAALRAEVERLRVHLGAANDNRARWHDAAMTAKARADRYRAAQLRMARTAKSATSHFRNGTSRLMRHGAPEARSVPVATAGSVRPVGTREER